jgi:hypothetical protein
MKSSIALASLLMSTLLTACGGGSGGSSPATGQPIGEITQANPGSIGAARPAVDETPPVLTPPPTGAPAATEADGKTSVGIGIPNLSYFDQTFAMVDLARQSQFKALDNGENVGADAQGCPSMDFLMIYSSTIIGGGTYKLKFKGRADLPFAINATRVYDAATNTTTADVVLSGNQIGNRWVEFKNTRRTPASTTSDGVTDIHLYRPGYATDGSAVFTTEFITAMRQFHLIRTMDALSTNGNPTESWDERTKIDYLGYTGNKGQAWESLIMLANATGRDLWINVPAKANDQYIAKLAQLMKYGSDGVEPYTSVQANPKYPPLRSDLKLYVEYANEVWNFSGGFLSYGWALDLANANRLNTSHPIAYDGPVTDQYVALRRWIAYRSASISLAFRAVFGEMAMMTRVRPILATQVGNANNYLRDGLKWAEGYHGQGKVQTLWYGAGGAAYYDSDTAPTSTEPTTMAAYFAGLPSATFASNVATDTLWTKAYGLKNIAYEGGPGPGGSATGAITGTTATIYAYSNDLRMKERMQVAHNQWLANGGDMLVYYVYSASHPWSFTNALSGSTVSDTSSTKLQAIDTIRKGSPAAPTLGTLIPSTDAIYLRSPASKVISTEGGSSTWKHNGTAWRITKNATDASKSEFLLVPVRATTAGKYKISVSWFDSVAGDSVEVFANGVLLGELAANQGAAGQPIKSQTITADFEVGITVLRIRAKTGAEIWLKDLYVEPTTP